MNIIDDEQIILAHKIDKIKASFAKKSDINGNIKNAFLILKYDKNEMLEHCCLHIGYILDNSMGKYAKIENIRFKKQYKRNGYLKKIVYKNSKVYKENGFKRIVLKAINDGVIAWYRVGFEYERKKDKVKILKKVREYLIKIKGIKKEDIKKYKDIKSIDIELLTDKKINFTDWIKNDESLQYLPMSLELK